MVANHAERFLTAYNRIEKYLKVQVHDKRELGFSRMVRMLSKSNAVLKQYQDDLLEFAQLRNAIVHNRVDTTYVIAEPHLSIVEQIERIERALTKPKQVIPFFAKKVVQFQQNDSLAIALEQIKGNGISTFPIYHGIRFIGILSEKGIAHWMAKNMNNSIASIRDASLGNVLACQGNHNYAFIQRSTSIYDAQEIFKDQIGQGYRLDALLITDSGDSTEKLLGMITPRDIIDIPLLWK